MHGTSIAAFAYFAEVTFAMAVAYAGLKSFRYRSEVQAHVREIFDRGLARLIEAYPEARNTNNWAILYRLGRLAELNAPAADPSVLPDRHFLKTGSYKMYNVIYASNLDKTMAIGFGIASVTVIWFGSLDLRFFANSGEHKLTRINFLTTVTIFYWMSLSLTIISITFHTYLWDADLETVNRARYKIWLGCHKVLIFLITMMFVSTSSGVEISNGLIIKLSPIVNEEVCYITIATILLLAAIVPILLIWHGSTLTNKMKTEALDCYENLVRVFDKTARETTLPPRPA